MPYAKRINPCGFILRHLTGGFALAARWAGLETVQFVEIDPFCQKVLTKNFPGVPIHDDIKTFAYSERGGRNGQTISIQPGESRQESDVPTWSDKRPFLLTGGFPCQPFSCAGKQRGTNDDRYLWPEMLRVISEVRPCWIIGENVAGINSLFQYDSFSEMEGKEYLTPEDAKADFKGISERTGTNSLWVVLDDLEKIGYSVQTCIIPACAVNAPHRRDRVWIIANNQSFGCGSRRTESAGLVGEAGIAGADCHAADTAWELPHGIGKPRGRWGEFTDGCESFTDTESEQAQSTEPGGLHAESCGKNPDAPDTEGKRAERQFTGREQVGEASCRGRHNNGYWQTPWLEVATRLCRVDDGLPRQVDRVNRLKALGNAIVPQVAYEIMKNIVEVEVTK